MQPEPQKHVSHWIAWSLIALFAGSLAFGTWVYYDQISTIYDNITVASIPHKKTTTKPTTTTADTTTTDAIADKSTENIYTNSKYGFSFELPKDGIVLEKPIYEGSEGVELEIGNKNDEISSETVWIKLTYQKNNSTYDELVANFEKDSDISKNDEIKVDSQKAMKYSLSGFASGFTVLSAKGREDIDISIYPDSESNIKIFDQIVSTFQFTK